MCYLHVTSIFTNRLNDFLVVNFNCVAHGNLFKYLELIKMSLV